MLQVPLTLLEKITVIPDAPTLRSDTFLQYFPRNLYKMVNAAYSCLSAPLSPCVSYFCLAVCLMFVVLTLSTIRTCDYSSWVGLLPRLNVKRNAL